MAAEAAAGALGAVRLKKQRILLDYPGGPYPLSVLAKKLGVNRDSLIFRYDRGARGNELLAPLKAADKRPAYRKSQEKHYGHNHREHEFHARSMHRARSQSNSKET